MSFTWKCVETELILRILERTKKAKGAINNACSTHDCNTYNMLEFGKMNKRKVVGMCRNCTVAIR